MDAWGFAFPGPLTTTAGLFAELEVDGEALPLPGAREVLLDSGGRPVAVIETVECRVARLADVDDRLGPDFTIDDDTLVVLQRFTIVERLAATP